MGVPKEAIETAGQRLERGESDVEDYLCITVQSQPGESQDAFKSRLSVMWSAMLREDDVQFENVYAETVRFEQKNSCWTRQYLVAEPAVEDVERRMLEAGVDFQPIDRDDRFSKYEAAPPEWMQIEH